MMLKSSTTMAEATRLTRAGRLGEAMAVLQGGALPADTSEASAQPSRAGSPAFQGPALPGLQAMKSSLARFAGQHLPTGGLAAQRVEALDGARFEDRAVAGHAGQRRFRLYTPSRYTGQALPLVVMLHGCQQTPEDFAIGTQMNEVAEELGLFVAYPEQTASANQSRCWNWFMPADQARGGGEPDLIAGITRQVMEDVEIDPARVYIAGLSAGGAAAAIMGAAYPDLYAAVCVHSGLACGAARDMASAFSAMQGGASPLGVLKHPLPIIVFHGDRDHTVNRVNGDQIIAQSMGTARYADSVTQGRSAGGVAYTRTVHGDHADQPTLEHWVLHGVGHAWSGGNPAGSFTEPRGPDASREMMRFFLEQPKPGAPR